MCTAGQRVSLTITGPGPSFLSLSLSLSLFLRRFFPRNSQRLIPLLKRGDAKEFFNFDSGTQLQAFEPVIAGYLLAPIWCAFCHYISNPSLWEEIKRWPRASNGQRYPLPYRTILGTLNVHCRAKGTADHYWPWAVFFQF